MSGWDRKTPWRQGQLLDFDAIESLNVFDTPNRATDLAIVASHDCDLAQEPGRELLVEVLRGSRVGASDGNCTHAKNARKFHIQFDGDSPFWGAFEATAKVAVHKMDLNRFVPVSGAMLSAENKATLQIWLASRYRRSAFPDEFERRLMRETRIAEKLVKLCKPFGPHIIAVLFDLDDGAEISRVGQDDIYTLDIYILHAAEPDFEAAERDATKLAVEVERLFRKQLQDDRGQWQHIELRSCEVISESVLSYQQFKRLKRWRMDHISLGGEPQQEVMRD